MNTVLCDRFDSLGKCFERTKEVFSELTDLDIRDPRPDGGIGAFSTVGPFEERSVRYTGEAAGLQDLVWGFGMRNAIRSGYLAAQSIIEGTDYTEMATKEFEKKLKASIVNRYVWEYFASGNYATIFNGLTKTSDPKRYMRSMHNFNPLQKMIYPIARRKMQQRYPELRF